MYLLKADKHSLSVCSHRKKTKTIQNSYSCMLRPSFIFLESEKIMKKSSFLRIFGPFNLVNFGLDLCLPQERDKLGASSAHQSLSSFSR